MEFTVNIINKEIFSPKFQLGLTDKSTNKRTRKKKKKKNRNKVTNLAVVVQWRARFFRSDEPLMGPVGVWTQGRTVSVC